MGGRILNLSPDQGFVGFFLWLTLDSFFRFRHRKPSILLAGPLMSGMWVFHSCFSVYVTHIYFVGWMPFITCPFILYLNRNFFWVSLFFISYRADIHLRRGARRRTETLQCPLWRWGGVHGPKRSPVGHQIVRGTQGSTGFYPPYCIAVDDIFVELLDVTGKRDLMKGLRKVKNCDFSLRVLV